MRETLIAIILFGTTGLFGPTIRLITSIFMKYDSEVSISITRFVYSLVFYVWPAQPFAVIEHKVGCFSAISVSVGLNILLFGCLGLIVGLYAKNSTRIKLIYIFICILIFIFAFWSAGFSFFYINWFALIVALFLYAVPFCFFRCFVKRQPHQDHPNRRQTSNHNLLCL